VSFLGDVWEWFTDGSNWSGEDGIPNLILQHLQVSAAAMLVAVLIALPVGLTLGHLRRGGVLAINISNVGRAVPAFGILIIVALTWSPFYTPPGFGWVGSWPAFVALTALAIPPMMTNTYVGMAEVDAEVREAARGMGMSGRQVLWRVETPLALPLIMAGVRIAAVGVIATATLASVVGFGGLGELIWVGFKTGDYAEMFAGVLLVALLALLVELTLAFVQRLLVSQGLRRGGDRIAREIEEVDEAVLPAAAGTEVPLPGGPMIDPDSV
jgi:osmoprotectant transport system permease protein